METYKDKIVFEATGHDHLMGIRYNKVDDSDSSSANYLNKILFPSVSPNNHTNPAFSTFTYNSNSGDASDLKCTFLKVSRRLEWLIRYLILNCPISKLILQKSLTSQASQQIPWINLLRVFLETYPLPESLFLTRWE